MKYRYLLSILISCLTLSPFVAASTINLANGSDNADSIATATPSTVYLPRTGLELLSAAPADTSDTAAVSSPGTLLLLGGGLFGLGAIRLRTADADRQDAPLATALHVSD